MAFLTTGAGEDVCLGELDDGPPDAEARADAATAEVAAEIPMVENTATSMARETSKKKS